MLDYSRISERTRRELERGHQIAALLVERDSAREERLAAVQRWKATNKLELIRHTAAGCTQIDYQVRVGREFFGPEDTKIFPTELTFARVALAVQARQHSVKCQWCDHRSDQGSGAFESGTDRWHCEPCLEKGGYRG